MKSNALKKPIYQDSNKSGESSPVRSLREESPLLRLADCFAESFHLAQRDNDLVPTRNALGPRARLVLLRETPTGHWVVVVTEVADVELAAPQYAASELPFDHQGPNPSA